jgi:hypothetical protein
LFSVKRKRLPDTQSPERRNGSFVLPYHQKMKKSLPTVLQKQTKPHTLTMKSTIPATIIAAALLSGCAGIRETNNQFTTHAECFRFIGNAIPGDDQAAARALVPAGSKVNITNLNSTPADWTSVIGIIGNVIGFHSTTISGTK